MVEEEEVVVVLVVDVLKVVLKLFGYVFSEISICRSKLFEMNHTGVDVPPHF